MKNLSAFASRQDGSAPLELLMMAPLLFWGMVATLAYFDGYRVEAVTNKTSLTLTDMVSRERDIIDDNYIDSVYELQKFLNLHDKNPELRVSLMAYHTKDDVTGLNPKDGHFHLVWSEVRGTSKPAMTEDDMAEMVVRLPEMSDGERMVVVETQTSFESKFKAGLRSVKIPTFMFNAPRRPGTVCFNNDPSKPEDNLC